MHTPSSRRIRGPKTLTQLQRLAVLHSCESKIPVNRDHRCEREVVFSLHRRACHFCMKAIAQPPPSYGRSCHIICSSFRLQQHLHGVAPEAQILYEYRLYGVEISSYNSLCIPAVSRLDTTTVYTYSSTVWYARSHGLAQ